MRDALRAIAGITILSASVLGIGWSLAAAAKFMLQGVDVTVAAALVAGATTVIVSVVSIVAGRYLEKRAQIEADLRRAKLPVYTELVTSLLGVLGVGGNDPKQRRPMSDQQRANQAIEAVKRLTPQVVAWAGDDVLAKWSWFRRHSDDMEPVQALLEFEQLLLAIRKDFGHSNNTLSKGDVLGLFINDVEDHLVKPTPALAGRTSKSDPRDQVDHLDTKVR